MRNFVTLTCVAVLFGLLISTNSVATAQTATYDNLYASVQGETNASAAYTAFAAKAFTEGYDVIGRLFLATADAEAKHAQDEWDILVGMGATVRPLADEPTVLSTEENLQAAFDGETYEYTVMYPEFITDAIADRNAAAERIFTRAMRAEEVHAGNYDDVKANLNNTSYINAKYGTVYRCPVCGEVVTTAPGRCPICGQSGDGFVMYGSTFDNLYASVQGETNASAAYRAFAVKAFEEGYPDIARLYLATSDAEAKHAQDEWDILVGMGATVRPVAATPNVGTTSQNLEASFNGETYEYTLMYPAFITVANAEGMTAARTIFNRASGAEEVHAGNYADVLANLNNAKYINDTYGTVYRCPTCGEVVTALPNDGRCPICREPGANFIMYPSFVGAEASAVVTKLNGNKNDLTITVTEFFNDWSELPFTKTFSIDNNAAATYNVEGYKVYVDTKGNVQIRACYIVP